MAFEREGHWQVMKFEERFDLVERVKAKVGCVWVCVCVGRWVGGAGAGVSPDGDVGGEHLVRVGFLGAEWGVHCVLQVLCVCV